MSTGYVIRRLFQIVPVVLGVVTIIFLIMHLTPGDPVEIMMGKGSMLSEEEVANLKSEYGLDKPIYVQYYKYIFNLLRGNFGDSIVKRKPVVRLILERLPATIELTLIAMLISLVIAIPTGIISAVKPYSVVDSIGTLIALIGISVPGFWLGIVLIVIFAVGLHILPVSGRIAYGLGLSTITSFNLIDSIITGNWAAFVDSLKHLAMPAFALGAYTAALTMRVTRASLLDVLSQDYIRTAKAKGLKNSIVLVKHALRNALIPTITVTALNIGVLLGGNMIIETVFGWPGMGRLVVDSVFVRDYPLVTGCVFVYALTYVLMNFWADVMYAFLNPKIRY